MVAVTWPQRCAAGAVPHPAEAPRVAAIVVAAGASPARATLITITPRWVNLMMTAPLPTLGQPGPRPPDRPATRPFPTLRRLTCQGNEQAQPIACDATAGSDLDEVAASRTMGGEPDGF